MTVTAVLAISTYAIARRKASPIIPAIASVLEQQTAQPPVPSTAPADLNLSVLPLSVRRVVIDAGHGGDQPGAISNTGLAEKDVTLDIALRLRQLLKQSPYEVLLTRESDQTVSLADRVKFANAKKADLFVSIHVNWMQPRSIRPLETYYVGPTNDPHVLQLASLENRQSGYSLSEYRQLLDKVYLDVRRNESHDLAKTVDAELFKSLKPLNPKLDDRGVKMAPFAVLVGTQMPAVLAEVSSLSNAEDDKLLRNDQYKQKIAVSLFEGITTYAKNLSSSGKRDAAPNGKI
jgi:N-acetylmuramoyl-L-alanine amidase